MPTENFRIVPEPAFNASGVSPVQPIRITVTDGTLLSVSLKNDEGADVAGELSDDQRRWVATEPLGYDRRYTWTGTAFDAEGERFPIEGSFRTLAPKTVVEIQPNLVDGGLYPRTAPIMLRFSAPVEDKDTVVRALKVDADPRTEGTWSWSEDDSVVTWRPEQQWEPGTNARLLAKLYAVRMSEGHYGASDVDIRFRITPD
ncbi:MAG: hypothetical protein GEV04_20290 [Actinophytocola sp.]|nr:hypothetical protein [Actinophytocola sp.]